MNQAVQHTGVETQTGATHTSPTPAGVEISLLDVYVLLRRNQRLLLRVTGLCGVIALAIALLWPPSYTATTSLLPPQQSSSFSSTLLSQLGGLGSLAGAAGLPGLKNPADLYVGLLKSDTVEDAMIERYELQREYREKRLSDTRKALQKHVTIDGSAKDGLIRISVEDHSADRAAELANGYIVQYRKLSQSLAIGEAGQRRLFLEQQLESTKNNLAKAEEDLKRTEQSTGMLQLDTQARALIESAGSLRAQVAAKEVQIQSMRTYAGEGNVDLQEAQQQLTGLRSQLAKLGGTEVDGDNELMLPKGKIPQAGLEYVRKLRDVKYNETIFEILARQYEAAKLDEAKEGAIVQVVDVAHPPDRKSGPSRTLIVLGGLALGFIGSVGWIVSGEMRRYIYSVPEYTTKLNSIEKSRTGAN
jgi:tyrosine-protein kinase Etk/Wzc